MPQKIYTSPYPFVQLVHQSIFSFCFSGFPSAGDDKAFIDSQTGRAITRAETKRLSLSLAWGLRNSLPTLGGVELTRGSTVLIHSPNTIAWPVMFFAGLAAGFICTVANNAYTPAELAHQWKDSRADLILTHPDLLQTVLDMFKQVNVNPDLARKRIVLATFGFTANVPSGFITMDELVGNRALEHEETFDGPDSHQTAVRCYSSGTTSLPKGVETSHFNMTSCIQMADSTYPYVVHRQDVMLGLLPFYHIFGVTRVVLDGVYRAVPTVVMSKFDPDHLCQTIERYRVTYMSVVPPLLLALLHHPATNKYNLKSLAMLYCGAAPLASHLASAVREKLQSVGANVVVGQGYGLTETSPVVTALPPKNHIDKAGSVGLLIPNMEARLVNEPDDGAEGPTTDAAEGEPGEFWVRGPNIMKGYLNNAEATRQAITPDAWFKTGDVAIRDADGYYYIVDRKKELIKYKGFQVPPAELEGLLLNHPEIADAAVIGVDSVADATELPRAYVVPSISLKTTAEKSAWSRGVQKWMESKVARHKYLRGGVVIVDAVPKSASGKILRKELRERAKKELVEGLRSKL